MEELNIGDHMSAPQVDRLAAQLADGANESVIIYSPDAAILHWNPASQRLYGWTSAEVAGRQPHDIFGAWADVNWHELNASGQWHGIIRRQSSTGVPVLANVRIQAFYDKQGVVTNYIEYGHSIDATEQRRMEEHLIKIEADFAHAARLSALGELVTSIAHEVRQPLSVIVTDADTGLRWLSREEPNIPKVRMLVTRIMENAHRANQVIRRIKDMAVKSDPVRLIVDMNAVVTEAATFVRTESQMHNISIRMQLSNTLPEIMGDRVQLQQVVVNLLINSIQAIAVNRRTVREITIETSFCAGQSICLCVRDSGGGIALEDLNKIFDGFFSKKAEGIGMGLAICRSIITGHGGTISARNEGTTGAVFSVVLPLPQGEPGTD